VCGYSESPEKIPVRINFGVLVAVFGSTLTALSLSGSSQAPANSSVTHVDPAAAAEINTEINKRYESGKRLYQAGKYLEARETFLLTAALAERAGSVHLATQSLINAGGSAIARQDTRRALPDFLRALGMAEAHGDPDLSAIARNNLAGVYLTSGHPEAAMQVSSQALASTAPLRDIRPKLKVQLAKAFSRLNRFPEALPIYREAADELIERGDLGTAARVLAMLGDSATQANRLDDAEEALDQALWMIQIHHLPEYASVLRGLAKIRGLRGDQRSAAALFDAALRAPRPIATRWMVYSDRGEFRLSINDAEGALTDFEEARRLISLLRADVVPADSDRVAMESGGFSRVPAGLVEAGNRLGRETGDPKYLEETFDAAEQDRLWSLRVLVPSQNDWRTRLPSSYWDILAQYQATERAFLEKPSPQLRTRAASLNLELEHIESSVQPESGAADRIAPLSALARAQKVLDSDSVLFSFLVTARGGWVWAVDHDHADVYPIPSLPALKPEIDTFVHELRNGTPRAASLGQTIYRELFGAVPTPYLAHKRWLLELDGPLFELPFAALQTGIKKGPVYLVETAAVQAVPGMLLSGSPSGDGAAGELLAVGDAVYNAADERFPRDSAAGVRDHAAALPRLPGTAEELRECSRSWGTANTHLLIGADASLSGVQNAIAKRPSIIHFATHVVPGPDEFSSGLIALSLDRTGAMGLLGPTEIVARPVSAALVVLNGCHSTQGDTLPAAGLMGLTRAWIGAGAGAVLATRWDIPDAGNVLMADFYRELKAHWARGPAFALQHAQLELLKNADIRRNPVQLGSFFLLGRF
jgi:tetratricopeptide (TPR) repeat protein